MSICKGSAAATDQTWKIKVIAWPCESVVTSSNFVMRFPFDYLTIHLSFYLLIAVFFILAKPTSSEEVFTNCGGTWRGESRGVISTPNFPAAYPVPIRCRWIIEAPEDKVIAIYFTQFYMREGLQAAEYAFFSESLYMGKTEFGSISSDREPTYLVTNKPVLVLDFSVRDVGNIHMRVREFFLDIFGFNITFEVLGKNESVRKDACLYHHCSFTGNCYASGEYRRYFCSCFEDYFGNECQYDHRCGPSGSNEMCQNGGTCRYYIGSTVRICECPPGYDGAWCEKEQKEAVQSVECSVLGCSQGCSSSASPEAPTCSCLPGYKLAEDGKTCLHTGRTRFLVSFRLYDWNVDLTRFGGQRQKELKKGIETALLSLFIPRLHHVENLTVLDFQSSNDAIVQFHLFGNMDDSEKARQAMEEALRRGKIGNYSVDRSFIRFEWEPGLSIQALEATEKMPVVEGSELTLACIVQGSSAMQVTWFKDSYPLNINTTYRTIFTHLLPKNTKKQFTALLGFDATSILDSGVFTCQISDWGLVQNRSIDITVLSVPKPLLTPMTATINEGEALIINCLSQDDVYGSFGYNWLKNGMILKPLKEPEMIEDLFPAGSRILLNSAISSATYTCIITSSAGATRKDSAITVINKGRKIITCPAEEYLNVKWTETAANSDNIQHCPKGYRGDVKRLCLLRQKVVTMWEEPDFSGCLSSEFLVIQRKFESLKMGYMLTTIRLILEDIRAYLHGKEKNLHVSEGVPVVDLLESIQDYEQKHMVEEEENIANNSKIFLDVVSFLLTVPHLIQKQTHLMKLHHLILNHGLLHSSLADGDQFQSFERSTLVMEVGKIRKDDQTKLKFPKNNLLSRKLDVNGPPPWLTDSLELDIGTWLVGDLVEVNGTLNVAVVFYKNLSIFLPKLFLSNQGGLDIEYHLHSRLVGVAVKGKESSLNSPPQQGVKVKARLTHLNQSFSDGVMWNISCGVADFSKGKLEFAVEGCEPVSSGNYTLCQCTQLGTYAVLLTTFLQNGVHTTGMGFEIIAGIGCIVCAFLICLTIAILLIFWRQIQGAITALKIQVCVALLGAYLTMLKALHESLPESHYPHVISVIQFFLLAAFCMQLCLGLTVYIEFVDMRNVRYPELKIAAMGWAFPLIVVGATLAAQVLEGFRLQSWWLKFETNYFYAYVTSVFIVATLQILLFLTVKAELRRHEKVQSHHRRRARNRASLLHRSLVVLVILLLVSVSSILYINFDDEIFKYIFAFCSSLLGLVVFLSYTLLSENINKMCFTCNNEEQEEDDYETKFRSRSNSYKSFLKPEVVGGDNEYCSDAYPAGETLEQRRERLRHIRNQIEKTTANHRDWKDPRSSLLVHGSDKYETVGGSDSEGSHQADPARLVLPGCATLPCHAKPPQHAWHCAHSRVGGSYPPLELQQLEGSPRSSHLYLVEPASASPYDLSPTGDSLSSQSVFAGHGCQLHRGGPHSESGSESSHSSSTDESGALAAGPKFVPYRPSSVLQFDRVPICEEDESEDLDVGKLDNHRSRPSCPHQPAVRTRDRCDDNGNPSAYLRERAVLRVSGSCSTEGDSSEMEMPASQNDDQGPHGKKAWSITTV